MMPRSGHPSCLLPSSDQALTQDNWKDAEFAGEWDIAGNLETNPDRLHQVDLVARLLRKNCPSGAHILDLGIGSGQVEAYLHGRDPTFFGTRSLLGIDASAAMLLLAKLRFSEFGPDHRIQLRCADFVDLDNLGIHKMFHAIICIQALHESAHAVRQAIFRWALARLRPGGVFYIVDRFTYQYAHFEPDHRVIWNAMRDALADAGEVPDFDRYHARYSAKTDHVAALSDYEDWLRAAGFEVAVLYQRFNRALLAARRP